MIKVISQEMSQILAEFGQEKMQKQPAARPDWQKEQGGMTWFGE